MCKLRNESFEEAGRLQVTDRHPRCDQRMSQEAQNQAEGKQKEQGKHHRLFKDK